MLTVHTNQLNTVIKFFQLCAYVYIYIYIYDIYMRHVKLKSPNREREKESVGNEKKIFFKFFIKKSVIQVNI